MKKEVYLARVIKANDGWYAIDFPDLPGTHAQCKNLSDVQKEAEESLCSFLMVAKAVGEEISGPSSTIELKDGEMAVIVTADLEAYQKKHDTKPIRKTVSIPQWMVDGAERKGLSLSKVLQESLSVRLAD
ncbi:MAG: type II toxin-antitoxin system HicB family antitoxin [Clostridia bacterium]|nr:type II toxin-antitoxin system HicB family antitoxin [Clostridia bacterium]